MYVLTSLISSKCRDGRLVAVGADVVLALVNIALGGSPLLRIGELIDKAVALIFGILETFHLLVVHTLLGQLVLTLHKQDGKFLAQLAVGIFLQGVLRSNDAGFVVVLAIITIAEIRA